jgi:hypothetical protein
MWIPQSVGRIYKKFGKNDQFQYIFALLISTQYSNIENFKTENH